MYCKVNDGLKKKKEEKKKGKEKCKQNGIAWHILFYKKDWVDEYVFVDGCTM